MAKLKIYTKTGDKGSTSLFGGTRVEKDSVRIAAYGVVDELNSQIGVVLSENPIIDISNKLIRIQQELMVLGSDLATPFTVKTKVPRISRSFTSRLEEEIDQWEKSLPKLNSFILPGGEKVGAALHLARTICRRAEREIVELEKEEKINSKIFPYINRLSDWLFVLARYTNHQEKIIEMQWKGRG